MKVNEIFYSIQGEGPQVGMPAIFIRFSGCNLTCSWCDSKYAKDGEEISIEDIITKLLTYDCSNIVLTGGEPLIQKDIVKLIRSLKDCNIYIETNGTVYDSSFIGFAKYIVSPKLEFLNTKYLESLRKWVQHATFKFVIENKQEFDDAIFLCNTIGKFKDVYMMPKGTNDRTLKKNMIQLADWIKSEASFVRLSPRLQIHLYGNERGY